MPSPKRRQRRYLGVSLDGRAGSLSVFVGQTQARELLEDKPNLKFVPASDVADQQGIGSIVAARRCGMGRVAGFSADELVSLVSATS